MPQPHLLDCAVDEELPHDRHHGLDQHRLPCSGQRREAASSCPPGRNQHPPDLPRHGPTKPHTRPHGHQAAVGVEHPDEQRTRCHERAGGTEDHEVHRPAGAVLPPDPFGHVGLVDPLEHESFQAGGQVVAHPAGRRAG